MPDMIRWLEHHAVYPTPNSGDNARAAPAWDTLFVNSLGNEKIFTMIVAVNYLEIKELLDLCVTKVADMIKGKNPTEIKTMFDLDSDSGVYDEMIGVEATAEDHHG